MYLPLPLNFAHCCLICNVINQVHIAGVGDFDLAGVTSLADPCPLPSAAKKKGLRDKEKLFYAPMSGLGDLLYDKDAVYININDHFVQYSKVDDDKGNLLPLLAREVLRECNLSLNASFPDGLFVCCIEEPCSPSWLFLICSQVVSIWITILQIT